MGKVVRHKRGDTLNLAFARTDASGNAVDCTGKTVEASMKNGSTTIALDTSWTVQASGTGVISKDAVETAAWSVAQYRVDIQFSAGGVVESSETFTINVIEDITGAA